MRCFLAIFLALVSPATLTAAETAPTAGQATKVTRQVCSDAFRQYLAGNCDFAFGEWAYSMDPGGKIIARHGQDTRILQLERTESEYVSGGLLIAEYGGDLILVYVLANDQDPATSRVVRFSGENPTIIWTLHIPGFNPSIGRLHGRHLYQAAKGFVSKIDLETGSYIWKHGGLYGSKLNPGDGMKAFGAFQAPPPPQSGNVHFMEDSDSLAAGGFLVVVKDETGQITFGRWGQ